MIAPVLAALALCAPAAAVTAAARAPRAVEVQVPRSEGWVTDTARLLSAQEERALEARLESWTRATGHQIAVLTVPSLGGGSLEATTIAVARAWGVGSGERDDGALLFVARDDKKMRIEVGRGLEGSLTDSICGRVLRDVIRPRFRNGDFGAGIRAGVDAMIAVVDGGEEAFPVQRRRDESAAVVATLAVLVLIVVLSILGAVIGRRGLARRRGAGWLGPGGLGGGGFLGGGFGGGGFGSGGGGGGFSGFGGGGFSGGGASGGW